jgi:hypothetical protein
MRRVVVHRLDAGIAALEGDAGEQGMRCGAGALIGEEIRGEAQRADRAARAGQRLIASLHPIVAMLDEPARLFEDAQHREIDGLGGARRQAVPKGAHERHGEAAKAKRLAYRCYGLTEEFGAVEWHDPSLRALMPSVPGGDGPPGHPIAAVAVARRLRSTPACE